MFTVTIPRSKNRFHLINKMVFILHIEIQTLGMRRADPTRVSRVFKNIDPGIVENHVNSILGDY
jgi:hypothetical protein